MIILKCDRCGAVYTPYGSPNAKDNRPNGFQYTFTSVLRNIEKDFKQYDLCPGCITMLTDWINGLKQAEEEKNNADSDT